MIWPPPIACGSAASMSVDAPSLLSKTVTPSDCRMIWMRNLSVPPPPLIWPS
jgi:hypothetical protein